jgi:hypothetical protein
MIRAGERGMRYLNWSYSPGCGEAHGIGSLYGGMSRVGGGTTVWA